MRHSLVFLRHFTTILMMLVSGIKSLSHLQ